MKRFNPLTGKTSTTDTPTPPAKAKPVRRRDATVPDTGDLKTALTLLWAHTGHTGDFWRLMGPGNVGKRAEIMRALMGRRIPQKECGLTVLRDLIYQKVGVKEWKDCGCESDRTEAFADYLAGYVGAPAPANGRSAKARTPTADATPAGALSNAPFTLAGAKSVVARAAAAVPLATYRALVPSLTNAEDHRFAFAFWCERHAASYSDWRHAHLAYLHPKAPLTEQHLAGYPPTNIMPFPTPPADSVADALSQLR